MFVRFFPNNKCLVLRHEIFLAGWLCVFALLSFPVYARSPSLQQVEKIISVRQSSQPDEDHPHPSPSAWFLTNQEKFEISKYDGPCLSTDTWCSEAWFLSGKISSRTQAEKEWNRAMEMSGGVAPEVIVLDSVGGDVSSSLFLSRKIQQHDIDTRVQGWGTCLSACVFILAAGQERHIDSLALVGIHAQNSSEDITERSFRDEAQVNDYVRQAIFDQEEGIGENLQIPLGMALEVVDNVSSSVQSHTGQLLLILEKSQISPLLVSYMARVPNRRREKHTRYLTHACMKSIGLVGYSKVDERKSIDDIQRHCGSLEE